MKKIIVLLPLVVTACNHHNPIDTTQKRDNVIDVSSMVEEFPVEAVLIGKNALINGSEKYLYILDAESTDKFISVFSLPEGEYIGQFMDFGGGPNEVAVPGSLNIFTSPVDGREKALVIDHGNFRTYAFDVDSALMDSAYTPRRYAPIETLTQPSHYIYLNDTLGFARKIIITPETNSFGQSLGKYNLITGSLDDFAPQEHIKGNRSLFTVSEKEGIVVEVGSNVDIVKIYDFDGNILKRIQGPHYKSEAEGWKAYFSSVIIADDYILGVYSGGDWNTEYVGKRIEVWDLKGNYIGTLFTDKEIRSMYYHSPSGKLWFSVTNDEIQFANFNLQTALATDFRRSGKTINEENTTAINKIENPDETATKNKISGVKDVPPLIFLSDNLQDTVTHLDIGKIILPQKMEDTLYPEESAIILSTQSSPVPDTVWIESVQIFPQYLASEVPIKSLSIRPQGGMFTVLKIGFTKDTPSGPFEGQVKIYAKGFEKPTILQIAGAIVYK